MRWFSTFDALLFPETKTEKKLNKQQKICAIYRRAAIAQSTVRKRFANFWQHCSRSCRRNGIWVFYDLTAGNLMDRIYISNVKKTGPFFKKIDHRRWNMDCLQSCGAKMSKGKRNELTIAKSGLCKWRSWACVFNRIYSVLCIMRFFRPNQTSNCDKDCSQLGRLKTTIDGMHSQFACFPLGILFD